jgi:hypothetical protein
LNVDTSALVVSGARVVDVEKSSVGCTVADEPLGVKRVLVGLRSEVSGTGVIVAVVCSLWNAVCAKVGGLTLKLVSS